MTLQEKVIGIHSLVQSELYRCEEDVSISGNSFCSTLIFQLLAFLIQRNVLCLGEYGTGKTTAAELLSCIMAGFPVNAVIKSEIRGSPELTEEKIIGPPNLGRLNQGVLETLWSPFVKCPAHIIDELPRIPEIKQSIVLEGVRTGQWIYHGQMLQTPRTCLIATANWESFGGSFDVCPALRDRFAVALETTYAGPQLTLEIALGGDTNEKCAELGLNDLCDEAFNLLNQPYDAETMCAFTHKFKDHLRRNYDIPTLLDDEMQIAQEEIRAVPLSDEAELFLMMFISSQNACFRAGQKRSSRFGDNAEQRTECPEDCRFQISACARVVNGGSRRIEKDLVIVAKALAWLIGAKHVDVELLSKVMPFVIWHRSEFSRSFLRELKDQSRCHPLRLEAASRYAQQLLSEFVERKGTIEEVLEYVESHPGEVTKGRIRLQGRPRLIKDLAHWFLMDLCAHPAPGQRTKEPALLQEE